MDCMRNEYIPQTVCLGTVKPGDIVVFPNEEDVPRIVTDNVRTKQATGLCDDTIGVVNCKNGKIMWYSDRYDCVLVEDSTLIYRLTGKVGPKHD